MTDTSKALTVVEVDKYLPVAFGDLNWREVISDNIGTDTIDRFALPRLRIPPGGGKSWEVQTLDGFESKPTVEGIITHWSPLRAYWRNPYGSGGGNQPPDCSSDDGNIGHGDPGGNCHDCPLNQFDTATNGRGKACKEIRAVFIKPANAIYPFFLSLPPTSLKAFRSQMINMANNGVGYWHAVVQLGLEQDKSADGFNYSKVTVKVLQKLSPEQIASFKTYRDEIRPLLDAKVVLDSAEFAGTGAAGGTAPEDLPFE